MEGQGQTAMGLSEQFCCKPVRAVPCPARSCCLSSNIVHALSQVILSSSWAYSPAPVGLYLVVRIWLHRATMAG